MRNNRHRFTALILLTVFVFTFFIAAGQRFLKPAAPVMPAGGNPSVRLTRDNGRESKGFFKRKDKNKNELAELNSETVDGDNDNKLNQKGIDREKLHKDCKEKIRKKGDENGQRTYKSISEKPKTDRSENGGSYNNRGGKMS